MPQPHASPRNRLQHIAQRAMLERGLLPSFAAPVLTELKSISQAAVETGPAIKDLRALLWASIDNDDSRDLDQLSVSAPMPGGEVKILVAIADVDALVKRGGAIDGHARANTTSVYTAAEIFPMLPTQLSTDLTSLNEGQDRLAIVIEMTVAPDGVVKGSDVYRATVHNRAKLAYNSVAAWLDGQGPMPAPVATVPGMEEQLRVQDRVAQAMKGLRHQHGALSLATIEAQAVFDGDALTGLRTEEKNRAKELIEDFMIAANGVSARYLVKKGFPSLRRVLRSPERWARIVDLAHGLGESLPGEPTAAALEAFLAKRRQKDPDRFADLSLSVVKLLGRGEYALELPGQTAEGHFGLAVRDYTHSTAPNRRFPDLLTQRLLKAALSGTAMPYRNEELAELARHCTEKEDSATKVERQVRKSAAAILLETRIGERFEGIVTGASSKGTWARLLDPPVEGKLVRGAGHLDVGDRVHLELLSVDVDRGFIDFAGVKG